MTILKTLKYIAFALVAQTTFMGCSRDQYAEFNTDPDAVLNPNPDYLFTQALVRTQDNDFEAFYDNYSYISRWSRVFLQITGNGIGVTDNAANANNRYGRFFEDIGPLLVDIQVLIDRMPEDQRARSVYKRVIPSIVKAWQAWYVSDVNGSIPYTEAFQARYGGTLRPKYETQQELFTIFEQELKDAATTLNTPQAVTQDSYGSADLYFAGDPAKWAKAANSLRLVIALRLMKRDPSGAQAIIREVLSHPAGLISSEAEEWALPARLSFTAGGNWNITGNGRLFVGESGVVDYMWNNEDPRLRQFFRPNQWSPENFATAKQQGVIPQSAVYDTRRYYGQFSNPEAADDPTKLRFFSPLSIRNGEATVVLDTVSRIQDRLFQPENDGGTGTGIFPVITYADVCFMRAEIAQRGWSNENAGEWYNKGIEASLRFYSKLAGAAQVVNYTAITDAEIAAFIAKPDIAYNAATGLEQIILQAYLNYFRNFNEAWALVKRTGMPNKNTALVFEDWTNTGSVSQMPRRFSIGFPVTGEYNFDNKKAAIDQMMSDPEFGQPSNIQGRIWWDKQ
ncbi:SusD/RagB family nutrient-binding outer membrane lipoprotein [Sphingobacterium corticis]|uniref:SusD/RagB family nutrient-binding outer membrane lipoprotein n=1 Tax=Sphingobacterium corticis TaxID=1812823 RepID=A0ABW5NJU3_9SPHI